MTNKMTNRKALQFVLDNFKDIPEDVQERLTAMAVALDKKASPEKRKPTATQKENEGFLQIIREYLTTVDKPLTCTEINKAIPEFADFNSQKVAALMKKLVDCGEVVKETVKGKSVFRLGEGE